MYTPQCAWQQMQPQQLQTSFCRLQCVESGICLDEDPQLQYFEQPVCENFLSIGTDFTSLSSGDDPDWESEEKNITDTAERLQKNQKERERVKEKKEWLGKLETVVKKQKFIKDSDKKKRSTEAHIVSLTTRTILELEKEVERIGGNRRSRVMSLCREVKKKKRKTSNPFIHFSKHYRQRFVKTLKEAMDSMDVIQPGKNPSQMIVQKLAAEAWNRLPQSVKGMNVEWQEWEKYWSEPDIKKLARGVLCQF